MPKCMLFVLGSTNVLHMFAVCAFKFLLSACFFGTALLYISSCSFRVSILDKRVPGVYALR